MYLFLKSHHIAQNGSELKSAHFWVKKRDMPEVIRTRSLSLDRSHVVQPFLLPPYHKLIKSNFSYVKIYALSH